MRANLVQLSTCTGLAILSSTMLLSACATSPPPAQAPEIVKICPQAPFWSAAFEHRLGAWLATQPSDSVQVQAIEDELALRKALRSCQS